MSDIVQSPTSFLAENGESVSNEQQKQRVEVPESTRYTAARPMVLPKFALKMCGVGFMPVGDIQVLNGQAGHGKSFSLSAYCVALLKGNYLNMTTDIENAKILLIDTEQQDYNVRLFQQRVHYLCGWSLFEDNERFQIRLFRDEDDISKRYQYAMQCIEDMKPDVVFIDGIADLVESVNEDKPVSAMVRLLMKRASENRCAICSVLHFNPGSDKMRGHLGSELERKSSDVLNTSYDENTEVFTIKQLKARNRRIVKNQFRIIDVEVENIDEAKTRYKLGLPVDAAINVESMQTAEQRVKVNEMMKKALYDERLNKSSLEGVLMKQEKMGRENANKQIVSAVDFGIIEKDHHGKYKYIGLPEGDITQQTLPFERNEEEELPY